MITCPKCGNELPDSTKFCKFCGNQLIQISESQPIPANTQKTKKSSKKIIIAIVAVLLLVAIVLGVIFIPEFINNKNEEDATERLTKILEESTKKPIVEMVCEDYDKNGTYEAYAVVGETDEEDEDHPEFYDADIYFVNEKEAQPIKENISGKVNGTIDVDNTIYVSIEVYDEGSDEGKSFIYTVSGDDSVEDKNSGKFSNVHEEDGKIVGTDENGEEVEVEMSTVDNGDVNEPKIDYNKLYEEYIQNTLIPQYGKGENIKDRIPSGSGELETPQHINMNSGVYSTYIDDLDADSIPDMITVRIDFTPEVGTVHIDLYKIENDIVTHKGEITKSDKYDNHAEQIAVYAVKNNDKTYLCVSTNDCLISTSSAQGYLLEAFAFEESEPFSMYHSISNYYGKGGIALHTIDGEDFSFNWADEDQSSVQQAYALTDEAYADLGLDEYSCSNYDGVPNSSFPERSEHIKIFYGGTDALNENGEKTDNYQEDRYTYYFAEDYTGFSK